jgi:hypothetical protein
LSSSKSNHASGMTVSDFLATVIFGGVRANS